MSREFEFTLSADTEVSIRKGTLRECTESAAFFLGTLKEKHMDEGPVTFTIRERQS